MPGMSGDDLCARLKADAELKNVPVILLTALSDAGDVLEAVQCGADGFITKPYDPDFLAQSIDKLMVRSAQPVERRADGGIETTFDGRKYHLKPDVRQITHLLLSTYENALQKNLELERANQALTRMKDSLREANEALEEKQHNLDRDLEAAAGIQRTLLPRAGVDSRSLRVAWKFQPCEMIGGDIFNMVRLDDRHYAFLYPGRQRPRTSRRAGDRLGIPNAQGRFRPAPEAGGPDRPLARRHPAERSPRVA